MREIIELLKLTDISTPEIELAKGKHESTTFFEDVKKLLKWRKK